MFFLPFDVIFLLLHTILPYYPPRPQKALFLIMGALLPVWLVSLSDGALPPSSVTSGANANGNFSPRRRRSNINLAPFFSTGRGTITHIRIIRDGRTDVELSSVDTLEFLPSFAVRTPSPSLPPHIPSTTIFHKIGLLRTAPNRRLQPALPMIGIVWGTLRPPSRPSRSSPLNYWIKMH